MAKEFFIPPLYVKNYPFFKRLPQRFLLKVLKLLGKKKDTLFYQVEIAGNKLELPSKIPLEEGKTYWVEKKMEELSLKILKENPPYKKDLEGIFLSRDPLSMPFLHIVDLFFMLLFPQDLSSQIRWEKKENQYYFCIFSPEKKPLLEGVFLPWEEGYILYLSPPLGKELPQWVVEDLPIKKIFWVNKEKLFLILQRRDFLG